MRKYETYSGDPSKMKQCFLYYFLNLLSSSSGLSRLLLDVVDDKKSEYMSYGYFKPLVESKALSDYDQYQHQFKMQWNHFYGRNECILCF